MDLTDRPPSSRRSARRDRRHLAAVVTFVLVTACATPLSPTGPVTPTSLARPSAAYADTLRIGNRFGRAMAMSNASFGLPLAPASLVLSALYRLTASLDAVPDLTDGPCLPQGDGTVIRCHLIETTFSDGSPLTADDVANSYRLQAQGTCSGTLQALSPLGGNQVAPCLGPQDDAPTYRDVRVVDARTVEFILTRPDPTFLTTILPGIAIEPRHVVDAAFAQFLVEAKGLGAAALTATANAIDDETSRDPPVCTTRVEALKALLDRLRVHWFAEDFGGTQNFDSCGFSRFGGFVVRQVATALQASGLAAMEAVSPLLSFNWQPVGTGPYRFVSQTADATVLEASPTYHGGPAATRYVRLVPVGGDGAELVADQVDVEPVLDQAPFVPSQPEAGLLVTRTSQPTFVALHYNLRPGHLFADRNLRLAMQLCIDLRRVVDAATGDGNQAIDSPFMPGSWAYDAALSIPPRDVDRADQLIEASGWRRGSDGIYAIGGQRLAAQIVVRGDLPARAKAADVIADQTKDCGMDVTSRPVRFEEDIGQMLGTYPHFIPGTKEPFDLYLGAWANWPDPGKSTNLFDSRLMTTAAHPDGTHGANVMGFDDPAVDRLIDAGLATYDQAQRAATYHALQEELAAQQPVLFLWSLNVFGAIRSTVSATNVPLDLSAPGWYWQPEQLAIRLAGT